MVITAHPLTKTVPNTGYGREIYIAVEEGRLFIQPQCPHFVIDRLRCLHVRPAVFRDLPGAVEQHQCYGGIVESRGDCPVFCISIPGAAAFHRSIINGFHRFIIFKLEQIR